MRRHRRLVIVGVSLSLALALLSYVRISPEGFSHRGSETWKNEATLALSQASHPELRSSLGRSAQPSVGLFNGSQAPLFATLIDVYAAFATSDEVIAGLQQEGLLAAEDVKSGKLPIVATVVPSTVNEKAPTPLLKISATGTSPAAATRLTIGATNELLGYVTARQVAAGIPQNERVELRVVKQSTEPELVKPRGMSKTIVILLAGLTATLAAAFIRDNIRRERSLQQQAGQVTALPVPDVPRLSPPYGLSEPDPHHSPVPRPPDSEVHEHKG